MSARQIIDHACARFGVADMIAGHSDAEVFRKVAPWLQAHSLPQLRAMLQARLPPNVHIDTILSREEQARVFQVVQHWSRIYG